MKKIWQTYQEYIVYLIFGVLTTLVNYAIYFICRDYFAIHYSVSNVIAFAIAVIFAFITNKLFVFHSSNIKLNYVYKEFISFVSLRIVSMLVETLLLVVFVELLKVDDGLMKIIVSIGTIVLNYVFSKWITFRK